MTIEQDIFANLRQHGKSSTMAAKATRLREIGLALYRFAELTHNDAWFYRLNPMALYENSLIIYGERYE